ncbi:MAG: hypothetical protein ACREEI_01945 [Stellaceae bacterium]
MTCEVVVMNRLGAALAADSAVTVGDGEKIYHHAQKLFALVPATPVGIMISGVPEIMGVPWEIIVKSYARQLGDRRFDRLEEYAQDFLAFVESSTALFPDSVQQEWFRSLVESYWRDQFAIPLGLGTRRQVEKQVGAARPTLAKLIRKDHAAWRKYSGMPIRGQASNHVPGGKVLSDYGAMLGRLEQELFGSQARSREIRQTLKTTVKFMYDKKWFHPFDRSWIAFAGMGEAEPFPALVEYQVGSIALGRLRWAKTREARVSRKDSAHVCPIAQADVIDMFFRGIDPELDEKLETLLARSVSRALAQWTKWLHRGALSKIQKEFRHLLEKEINEKYEASLIGAVDVMPQRGLAQIAETLVGLTAFRKRISITQKETVDDSISVALLSRGDGFVWLKHDIR